MSLLKAQNISKSYKLLEVVKDISLEINSGEVVGLLGPNGAGKTTAFHIAAGLIYPNNGKVIINGEDITNEPLHVRAKFGLGYLPQESSIFSDLSVENNLLGIVELSAVDSQEASKMVTKLIDDFGLSKILNVKGRMLSGGQRRKVEIARTLISSPNLILLDEPFAGIDPIAVEEIKELLKEISKKDISILITDHNVRETLSLCDRAIILVDGNIIADGTEKQLKENEYVGQKYFGKMFS